MEGVCRDDYSAIEFIRRSNTREHVPREEKSQQLHPQLGLHSLADFSASRQGDLGTTGCKASDGHSAVQQSDRFILSSAWANVKAKNSNLSTKARPCPFECIGGPEKGTIFLVIIKVAFRLSCHNDLLELRDDDHDDDYGHNH